MYSLPPVRVVHSLRAVAAAIVGFLKCDSNVLVEDSSAAGAPQFVKQNIEIPIRQTEYCRIPMSAVRQRKDLQGSSDASSEDDIRRPSISVDVKERCSSWTGGADVVVMLVARTPSQLH